MNSLRALLLALPLALLLAACSPPKEADYAKLGYKGGVFLDPDSGAPFTGIARQTYPDGKPKGEYHFKDGHMHGNVKEWHPNGKPSSETEFKNGTRTGRNIEWTTDGKPYRERVYDGDKIVSEKNYDAK